MTPVVCAFKQKPPGPSIPPSWRPICHHALCLQQAWCLQAVTVSGMLGMRDAEACHSALGLRIWGSSKWGSLSLPGDTEDDGHYVSSASCLVGPGQPGQGGPAVTQEAQTRTQGPGVCTQQAGPEGSSHPSGTAGTT